MEFLKWFLSGIAFTLGAACIVFLWCTAKLIWAKKFPDKEMADHDFWRMESLRLQHRAEDRLFKYALNSERMADSLEKIAENGVYCRTRKEG